MGLMVQYNLLLLRFCAIVSVLVLQGSSGQQISPSLQSSAVPPITEGAPSHEAHGEQMQIGSPSPISQSNGFHPRQAIKGLGPSLSPIISMNPPTGVKDPIPAPVAVPAISPSKELPQHPPVSIPPIPESLPPIALGNNLPDNKAPISQSPAPDTLLIAPAPSEVLEDPPNVPQVPPSIFPAPVASPPSKFPMSPEPTTKPMLPNLTVPIASPPSELPRTSPPIHPNVATPPSHLREPNITPTSTPPRSIDWKRGGKVPVSAPPSGETIQTAPAYPAPVKSPAVHKSERHSIHSPPPDSSNESPPITRAHSPASLSPTSFNRHHRARENISSPMPSTYPAPPPTKRGSFMPLAPIYPPTQDSWSKPRHHAPPPLPNPGPLVSPLHSSPPNPSSYMPSSNSPSPSEQTKMPFLSPKISPSRSSPRNPKTPYFPPIQALPPPPPNKDCSSIMCMDPLTNPAPGAPCNCVLPMQIGLRLTVALYTFFPLVSELATEIADGVFMRQSQVRIMGANAASEDPEKTIVLIDLVPLGEQFDSTTAYVTSQRFWKKKVTIKSSLFGDYEVLYVRYPGLPPSPPTAPAGIGGQPYGRGKSGQTIKPLGVDVSKQRHNNKPSASIIVIIVLSACVAAILSCLLTWILLSKRRDRNLHLELTQPATVPSLTKSSGVAGSMLGSGPISASLSFESSIVTYTGSTKTFTSADIERATNNFNDSQVLGEGGFGRVYSGVLEDGTEVAVKVLKRDDQQGGREFLAEIEMLSRLHHRNLVRLIGICTEDRMRCLVYELIPNGSVESHLHGVDKETAPLDWSARLKIALGAARALAYLHEDSSPRVIHRDFKSSNILLETDFTPKVSDFGLARTALDEENQHISTRVMGTFGYVAPEYAMTGHLLVKSDVYSYGVVLLELLTGRKPVDMSQPPGQENLVAWARPLLTSREGLESIIEPMLGPDFPLDSIAKVAAIASMCVQPEVSHRPFMGEVVQALKLVCNESEETNDLGARSSGTSHEDVSVDFGATRISTNSEYIESHSPLSNYQHERDVERGFPMSDLHGAASAAFDRLDSGNSYRRRSSSGPLKTGRTLLLWERTKRLSRGGSISEHRDFSRLWPTSR